MKTEERDGAKRKRGKGIRRRTEGERSERDAEKTLRFPPQRETDCD